MATFIILRHPVAILVTSFTKNDKFYQWSTNSQTTDNKQILSKKMMRLDVNKKAYDNLVGPTLENLSSHPLGVLSLNNQLYFNLDLTYKKLDLFITKLFWSSVNKRKQ